MEANERKNLLDSLIDKAGKNNNKLSSSDVDMLLIENEIEIDEMGKMYSALESHGIEIIDDMGDALLDELTIDIDSAKTYDSEELSSSDAKAAVTDDPVKEPRAAKEILKALGMGKPHIEVVSCPTCARCKINLIDIAKEVSEKTKDIPYSLKVAVMGCVVNGPGEARDADIGIAGGDGCAVMFKKGESVGKFREDEIVSVLLSEIDKMIKAKGTD